MGLAESNGSLLLSFWTNFTLRTVCVRNQRLALAPAVILALPFTDLLTACLDRVVYGL